MRIAELTPPAGAIDVGVDGWEAVCRVSDLEVERGRAALVGGAQLALFLLVDGGVHAVDNRDPFSGAHVISRGIVGSREGVPTVASPMHKQVFDLRTGECLESQGKEPLDLGVWRAEVRDGTVHVWTGRTC